MQNRYAGDIGDFGKLGLLRMLQSEGLSVGVNWYLTPDESHNSDGGYVQYLRKNSYRDCDDTLWDALKVIVDSGERSVFSLQESGILEAAFFSELLDFSGRTKPERDAARQDWHRKALNALSGVDVVFADPDNGLLVPSAVGTAKENKFVKLEELRDYYRQGSSVVYYQHKARRPDEFYTGQHRKNLESFGLSASAGFGLKFMTTSQRYYFFIMQPEHMTQINEAANRLQNSPWKGHFLFIALS